MAVHNYKLPSDKAMLHVIDFLVKSNGIDAAEIYDRIGYSPKNLSNVRAGRQSFGIQHIAALCKAYHIDANYILGLSRTMSSKPDAASPLHRIRQAVAELELAAPKKRKP